jgi:hypothetical protein
MSDINNLIHTKRELKNEWRKEKKRTDYDSDVDGEYYADALEELESLIAAQHSWKTSRMTRIVVIKKKQDVITSAHRTKKTHLYTSYCIVWYL